MSDNLEITKQLFKPRVPSPFGKTSPSRDSTMSSSDLKTCFYCQQCMYQKEIGYGPIKGNYYHDGCFKCANCDIKLDLKSYHTNGNDLKDKQVYCKRHAPLPTCSAAPYKARTHFKATENGSVTSHSGIDGKVTPPIEHQQTDNTHSTVSSNDSTYTAKYGWNIQYKDAHTYVDVNGSDSCKINYIPQLPHADKLPNLNIFDNKNDDEDKPLTDDIIPIAFEISKKLDSLDNDKDEVQSDKEDELAKDVYKTHISDNIPKNDDQKTDKIIDAIISRLDEIEDEDSSKIIPIEPPQQPKINVVEESTVIGTLVDTVLDKENAKEDSNETPNISIIEELLPPPKPSTPEPEPIMIPKIVDKTPEKKPNQEALIANLIINSVEKTPSPKENSPRRESTNSAVSDLLRTIGTPKATRESVVSTDMPIVIDPTPPKRISKDINNNTKSDIEGSDKGLGIIKLTIYYDDLVNELSIGVECAKNLINTDKKSLSDPYARIWLLPDPKDSSKRKTKVMKDNLNPVWHETFSYTMTFAEATTKTLKVNLKDEKGIFQKQATQFLGDVFVPLKKIEKNKPVSKWYYLQPKSDN